MVATKNRKRSQRKGISSHPNGANKLWIWRATFEGHFPDQSHKFRYDFRNSHIAMYKRVNKRRQRRRNARTVRQKQRKMEKR